MALCNIATYRRITHDAASLDADVTAALADAQAIVEEHLRVPGMLESASHTESLPVFADGRVYPTAQPVTAVATPAGMTIDPVSGAVYGAAGTVAPGDDFLINNRGIQTRRYALLEMTYTGGFTSGTLPMRHKRGICNIARELLRADSPVLTGAKSMTVGDTSVTFDQAQTPETRINAILSGIRRRQAILP